MNRPLCLVLIPSGRKPGVGGGLIDFGAVYAELIAPAVQAAGLEPLCEPLRTEEESAGGSSHKAVFERLVLCEYAVAELTAADARVFYELGFRQAVRPHGTVAVFAGAETLPFAASPVRSLSYEVGADGRPLQCAKMSATLSDLLRGGRKPATGGPPFQLLEDLQPQTIAHEKTDVFRERVAYSKELQERLARARKGKVAAELRAVERGLGKLADVEAGVVVDLFLSYRALKAWDDMIRLHEAMSPPLQRTTLIQEQRAFALNRAGRGAEAERVLQDVLQRSGPSSETYAILGRVYKDRWDKAVAEGGAAGARGLLDLAIEAYRKGFEADWRDAYPGVNAVTLMEVRDPPDDARHELLPVVTYAVRRKVASGVPDYWDHATLLELAVLGSNPDAAHAALGHALAAVREPFEPETTARNLRLIREARERRGAAEPWIADLERELRARAQ